MILIGAEITWQRDEETGEWKITPAEKNPQPKERRIVLARERRLRFFSLRPGSPSLTAPERELCPAAA
jgi:hypothetical protein